jgi:hypothetical protein
MAIQDIHPPPQGADSGSIAGYLGKDANMHVTVCFKVTIGLLCGKSRDHERIWAKQPFLCQFLNEGFLQETYLAK